MAGLPTSEVVSMALEFIIPKQYGLLVIRRAARIGTFWICFFRTYASARTDMVFLPLRVRLNRTNPAESAYNV
jgi:hypothetical protein